MKHLILMFAALFAFSSPALAQENPSVDFIIWDDPLRFQCVAIVTTPSGQISELEATCNAPNHSSGGSMRCSDPGPGLVLDCQTGFRNLHCEEGDLVYFTAIVTWEGWGWGWQSFQHYDDCLAEDDETPRR